MKHATFVSNTACLMFLPANLRQFSLLLLLVMAGVCTFAVAQSGVVYLPPAGKTQSKPANSTSKSMTVDDVIKTRV